MTSQTPFTFQMIVMSRFILRDKIQSPRGAIRHLYYYSQAPLLPSLLLTVYFNSLGIILVVSVTSIMAEDFTASYNSWKYRIGSHEQQ